MEVNEDLESALESIGDSPYEAGWMIRIEPSSSADFEGLLDATSYEAQLGS